MTPQIKIAHKMMVLRGRFLKSVGNLDRATGKRNRCPKAQSEIEVNRKIDQQLNANVMQRISHGFMEKIFPKSNPIYNYLLMRDRISS